MKKGVVKIFGYVLILVGFFVMVINLSPAFVNPLLNETNNFLVSEVASYSVGSYGMYGGFILILIGVFLSLRKNKTVSKRREVPVTENGTVIEYRRE
jgi:hypothetical protein